MEEAGVSGVTVHSFNFTSPMKIHITQSTPSGK
jgi:hypothetical protein